MCSGFVTNKLSVSRCAPAQTQIFIHQIPIMMYAPAHLGNRETLTMLTWMTTFRDGSTSVYLYLYLVDTQCRALMLSCLVNKSSGKSLVKWKWVYLSLYFYFFFFYPEFLCSSRSIDVWLRENQKEIEKVDCKCEPKAFVSNDNE